MRRILFVLAAVLMAFSGNAQVSAIGSPVNGIKVVKGSSPEELVVSLGKMVTDLTSNQNAQLISIYAESLAAVTREAAAIGNLAQILAEEMERMARGMDKGNINERAIKRAMERIQAKTKAYTKAATKIRADRDARAVLILTKAQKAQYKKWLQEVEANL